ncbi:hypothetical protein [Nannocystis sp. SCPEA4]|uniref:hypothetical protein n=1 Tax=Nannocystis sp. SCPEA4 TaxID=2996787 RepID=UPI00226F805C|nr:hypothetical protein [Nannocystis sp. SCPEA4]MCY1055170.1 hypothetical protein [Nannocystis sp. SCPEA4]
MALLPETRLSPCPACAELLHAGSGRCPHCGASLSEWAGSLGAAALLFTSLSLSGCLVTALYGGPATESDSSFTSGNGTSTTTGTTTGTTSGTSTDSGTPTTGMAPTSGTSTTSTTTTGTTDATTGDTDTAGTTTGEPDTGTSTTATDTGSTSGGQ